jgi:hypothetical protein
MFDRLPKLILDPDCSAAFLVVDFNSNMSVVYYGLTIDRTDGAIVRYITPILKGEPKGAADERLQRLMRESLPKLPRFGPG